jgi:hypothetical protein
VTAAFCNDPAAAILTFFEELAVAGPTENSNGRNQRGIYSAQTRVSAEDKFGNTTYRHELNLCYSHVVPYRRGTWPINPHEQRTVRLYGQRRP